MARNKIVYGNEVLIDLTQDDVIASDVAVGKKFHDRTGEILVGTNTYDADTSDADAIAGDILSGRTAYVHSEKLVGTMTNNGAVNGTIADKTVPYIIPSGYHDGTGTVEIDETESAKLIPNNIKAGVQVLGVVGTYGGEDIKAQSKSVEAYTDKAQTILPDEGFDYLSQVEVAKIYYDETENSAGGKTVTIGHTSPTV